MRHDPETDEAENKEKTNAEGKNKTQTPATMSSDGDEYFYDDEDDGFGQDDDVMDGGYPGSPNPPCAIRHTRSARNRISVAVPY